MSYAVTHIRAALKQLSADLLEAKNSRADLEKELSALNDREANLTKQQAELLDVLKLIERPAEQAPEQSE